MGQQMSIDPGPLVPKQKQLCHVTSRRQSVKLDTSLKASLNTETDILNLDLRQAILSKP